MQLPKFIAQYLRADVTDSVRKKVEVFESYINPTYAVVDSSDVNQDAKYAKMASTTTQHELFKKGQEKSSRNIIVSMRGAHGGAGSDHLDDFEAV